MSNWYSYNYCNEGRILFTNQKVSFVMIRVPETDFFIGETPVTQELWEEIMGNNPSHKTGSKQLPVESVSHIDCMSFIECLNSLTGRSFRLPSVKEWTCAARSGDPEDRFKYAGSNDPEEVGWFAGLGLHPVRLKKPNRIGIFDMTGNVWEWTSDIDTVSPPKCFITQKDGTMEAQTAYYLKGGSHFNGHQSSKLTSSNSFGEHYKNYHLGMRLVLPAE